MAATYGICHVRCEAIPMTQAIVDAATAQSFKASGGAYGLGDVAGAAGSMDFPVTEMTYNPGVSMIETGDEIRGLAWEPANSGAGQYMPEMTFKTRVSDSQLAYLLYWATGDAPTANTTSPDISTRAFGTATTEFKFNWRTGNTPRTAAIYFAPGQATSGPSFTLWGAAVQSLALSFDDAGSLTADISVKGLYLDQNALPSVPASASYTALAPFKKGNFTLGNVAAPSFTSSTSRAIEWTMTIENNLENFFSFQTNSLYPDAVEFADVWPKVTGSVTKRSILASEYNAYRQGTPFSVLTTNAVKALHDADATTGASTAHRFLFTSRAINFTGFSPEAITNKRVVGGSYDWAARYSTGGSEYANFYVVCPLASTYFADATYLCVTAP